MASEVGGALRGEEDPADSPLRNIVTSAGSALNRSIFDDPASRSALLQIGLNLMQPQAQGQTIGGHIGEAVGSGGEAVGRIEAGDIAQQNADTKLQQANTALQRARDMADNRQGSLMTAIGANTLYTAARNNEKDYRDLVEKRKKDAKDRAEAIDTRVNKITSDVMLPGGESNPDYVKYHGKTPDEIEAMVKAEQDANDPLPPPPPKAEPQMPVLTPRKGGVVGQTPPPPTAPNQPRLAPDGNYYIQDKNGKFFKVVK